LHPAPTAQCGDRAAVGQGRVAAGEIANLTWDMVVDATGQLSGLLELRDTAAKKGSGRSIPVHPDLAAALAAWRQVAPPSDHVITSERGGPMTRLSSSCGSTGRPQASPAGRASNPLPPVRAKPLRIGSLARPPSIQTPLVAPGP